MAEFQIESYTVSASLGRSGVGTTLSERVLRFTSVSYAHCIRNHAVAWFLSNPGAGFLGQVYNVDQPNFSGHTIYGFASLPEFAEWYDIVRSEKPLTYIYGYDGEGTFDSAHPTRQLNYFQITTGSAEPIGEGPADVSP